MHSLNFRDLVLVTPLLLLGVALFYVTGNRFVVTPSIPVGWWHLDPRPAVVWRGMTIVACLPTSIQKFGLTRGYLPRGNCSDGGMAIAKVVVALPGDTIDLAGATMRVNRRKLLPCGARTKSDAAGRAMQSLRDGRYVLGSDDVWLCGSSGATAWDSRYYGPIASSLILGTIRPVWIDAGARAYASLIKSASQ